MVETITAAEFKAKCLSLLDEVSRTGQEIVITKRGRVVARLAPALAIPPLDLRGTVHYASEEDVVGPMDEPWPGDADD